MREICWRISPGSEKYHRNAHLLLGCHSRGNAGRNGKQGLFQRAFDRYGGKDRYGGNHQSVPNHALFIGFAPYENPEISLAVRIGNGYSSDYASQVGCKVIEYYFGLNEEDEIITGGADISEDAGGGD